MNQNVANVLKTICHSIEKSMDYSIFEPNTPLEESEAAIQMCVKSFDTPNFIAVTVCGQRYVRETKDVFIEDMRDHFMRDPKFVIDGMFEYRIIPSVPGTVLNFEHML